MSNTRTTGKIRRDDDELMGLLVGEGEQWRPVTVFGASLAEPMDVADAEAVVRERGLSSLADRWRATIDGEQVEVWLLEVSGQRVRLRRHDPMATQTGHGEWHDVTDLDLRLG